MKNAAFWDMTPCGSCKNRRIASIIRVARIGELGTTLAVTSNRSMLLDNFCHPEDVGDTILRNIGS
jgi:hypothetical protein